VPSTVISGQSRADAKATSLQKFNGRRHDLDDRTYPYLKDGGFFPFLRRFILSSITDKTFT